MGLRFIREPSAEPNISNADDVRLFRYAVGGRNGYIKGYGTGLSAVTNGLNFEIKSGIVVLDGYESEIDANGVTLTMPRINAKRYHVVYYDVNLLTQETNISSKYGIGGYPSLNYDDDLTSLTTGRAQMELYRFETNGAVIINVQKIVKPIEYDVDKFETKKLITTGSGHELFGGYEIPEASIPSSITSTIANIIGYNTTTGTLNPGWYAVKLAGGGGGGGNLGKGGKGGYLLERFFVPYPVKYKLMSGEGGKGDHYGGGGGGGGSVLDIPQLGILFIASGGGGGGGSLSAGGGGGGGYGAGGGGGRVVAGTGSTDGGAGGGGGGCAGGTGQGTGSGGGQKGRQEYQIYTGTETFFLVIDGGKGGLARGNGGTGSGSGDYGGNNVNSKVYEATAGGNATQNGNNGSAELSKLG